MNSSDSGSGLQLGSLEGLEGCKVEGNMANQETSFCGLKGKPGGNQKETKSRKKPETAIQDLGPILTQPGPKLPSELSNATISGYAFRRTTHVAVRNVFLWRDGPPSRGKFRWAAKSFTFSGLNGSFPTH